MTIGDALLAEPMPRRSLLLCLLGALIGTILGITVVARSGGFGSALPADDAATVNGVPILMSDLSAQVETVYGRAADKVPHTGWRSVLNDMIADELRVQHGVEIGAVRRNNVVRAALVQATEGQLVSDAMASVPAPNDLRRWYIDHRAGYADSGYMKVHEYILPRADTVGAARAVAGLRAGRSATALGLKDSGRLQGEDELYFAAKLHLGDALFAIAERMSAGQVADPVPLVDGIHILAIVYNHGPRPVGYDAAAEKVRSDFMTDKTTRLQHAGERYLRGRADIRIASTLR